MSRRHKRAHARIELLEGLLLEAANHIDSAADVIEDLDGDIDGECRDERRFARKLRKAAHGP